MSNASVSTATPDIKVTVQDLAGKKMWLFERAFRKCYLLRCDPRRWDFGCGFASDITLKRKGTRTTKSAAMAYINTILVHGGL